MEQNLQRQLLALLKALALGAALGLGYDLLRPPRRRGGRLLGARGDAAFALLAASACFLAAMEADSGRLGLWELTAALIGFLLYQQTLSPLFLPIFTSGYDAVRRLEVLCKIFSAKFQNSAKKNFQKVRK